MIEVAAVLALVYIGWMLERISRGIRAVEVELSTTRWQQSIIARGRYPEPHD